MDTIVGVESSPKNKNEENCKQDEGTQLPRKPSISEMILNIMQRKKSVPSGAEKSRRTSLSKSFRTRRRRSLPDRVVSENRNELRIRKLTISEGTKPEGTQPIDGFVQKNEIQITKKAEKSKVEKSKSFRAKTDDRRQKLGRSRTMSFSSDSIIDNPCPETLNSPDTTPRSPHLSKTRSPNFGQRLARRFKLNTPQSSEEFLLSVLVNGEHDTLEKLLENITGSMDHLYPPGVSLLHQAIVLGDMVTVRMLVERGADVKLKTCCDVSPTLLAAQCGQFEMAQFLISRGGDVKDVENGHF